VRPIDLVELLEIEIIPYAIELAKPKQRTLSSPFFAYQCRYDYAFGSVSVHEGFVNGVSYYGVARNLDKYFISIFSGCGHSGGEVHWFNYVVHSIFNVSGSFCSQVDVEYKQPDSFDVGAPVNFSRSEVTRTSVKKYGTQRPI